ncbi:hypothetical protein BH09VER1_BH09VER1_44560 [soil metagenome]
MTKRDYDSFRMKVKTWLEDDFQIVRLPGELQLPVDQVSLRRLGDGVLLAPIKAATWPPGYFEGVRITDDSFARPDQVMLPTERLAKD